nr:DNA translocase FtsK [Psychrobacter sp. I-STPA6b]
MSSQRIQYAKQGVFTLLAIFLAAYIFVILLTYTPNDPSWSHISSDMMSVNNMGGVTGAWIADLLYTFLGMSAWLLLVFIAYEAIQIWWQRQQPIWILRMLAYTFLLLSGSALCVLGSSFLGMTGQSELLSTAQAVALNLQAGGVIGYEVAIRLAHLLTSKGALVFALLFFLITITFVFNIRWIAFFRHLFGLSWLGSGVKDNANHEQGSYTKMGDSNTENELIDEDMPEGKYGQLSLKLPEPSDSSEAVTRRTEVKDVLGEFLAKSGLRDAIVKFHEEEAEQLQEKSANPLDSQPAVKQKPSVDSPSTQPASQEGSQQKIEPSFAWNDHQVIDELLVTENQVADVESTIDESQQVQAYHDEPAKDSHLSSTPVQVASTDNEKWHNTQEKMTDRRLQIIMPEEQLSGYGEVVGEEDGSELQELDLTPTNTPPADPTQAPRVMDDEIADTQKPSVRFAVPEGDASNHIVDMVPEEEYHHLPEVSDDEAFFGRSRAMQTAKYRAQLTPIPELSILDKPDPDRKPSYTVAELEQLSELLEIKLQEFNVKAEVVNAIPGPVVTRFEVELAAGVKASKVTGISRDLARSLSMASLRVVEVIPGKPYIGIEVPNKKREMVRLIELLDTEKYKDPHAQISMAMGKDIGGKPIITDLAKAPHMLVAGTTGSGKSVLVNAMLLSMLLKYKPDELRMILIDPKQLELANYNDIPHLLTPVVTDMNEAASSLSWCVAEMERRYQLMSLLKVRKLGEFNKKVVAAEKAGRPIIDPLWRPNDSVSMDKAPKLKTLPLIVIVADEFADMIMQVGKQAEELITRLAQKSRAAGIHLMLATQRPSVDVITGLIKANIPVRAALRVNSKVDSRTILDSGGAEDMLGNGDMLFLGPGQIEPDRVHGAYVSDEEVNRVCDAWRERGAPDYIDNMASNFELTSPSSSSGNTSGEDDDLYDEAVAFVMETRKVSASSIQRKFSIGYNRAARIVDSMEEAGLVSSMGKSGKRELLI